MPFGTIGLMRSGMRQVVGFGDRSTQTGTFGGKFGARHCNQWGLYGIRVRQRRDAALFPNYCRQTCYSKYKAVNLTDHRLVCCVSAAAAAHIAVDA